MASVKTLKTPNGITFEMPTGLFINGEFVASKSGKTFESISPIDEEKIVDIAEAQDEDAESAIQAAEAAYPKWWQLTPEERARYLYRVADALEAKTELFASLETWDNGKAIRDARIDIKNCIGTLRNYAGYANRIYGRTIDTDTDSFNYTIREPIGACGAIIPWNFPLLMAVWKLAPALACGCTMVLKSAESTPLSVLLFCSLLQEVGVPKGVLNVLSAQGPVGGYLSSHPRLAKIAFTGSTTTGRKVLEASAKSNLKKVTLELGGKSPNIVFKDANTDTALDAVVTGIFHNAGQVCCAGSRLIIHEDLRDKFLEHLKGRLKSVKIGDPYDEKAFYGAETNKAQFDKVLKYIEIAKAEGATLVTGGSTTGGKGYFVTPTIFSDLAKDATIVREEVFGPVLTVQTFKTVDEAIEMANDTIYGLAASVQTEHLNTAHYVARRLQAGTVWINSHNNLHWQIPFGGFKQSGIGRELGEEVIENFTQVKSVRIGGINLGNQ